MRQIKFRAWNPKTEKMIDLQVVTPLAVVSELSDRPGLYLPFDERYILMQFTGLHDTKGKEIYEGDICQIMMRKKYGHQSEGLATVGAVEFGAVYVREDTLYAFDTFHIDSRSIRYLLGHDLEVIGNIYEHSHLLTPTP